MDLHQVHGKLKVFGSDFNTQLASVVIHIYAAEGEKDTSMAFDEHKMSLSESKLVIKDGKVYYDGIFDANNIQASFTNDSIVVQYDFDAKIRFSAEQPEENIIVSISGDVVNTSFVPSKDKFEPKAGSSYVSSEQEISESSPFSLKINGNPVEEKLNFVVTSKFEQIGSIMVAGSGQVKMSETAIPFKEGESREYTVDVTAYPPGLYTIHVTANGQSFYSNFIKQ